MISLMARKIAIVGAGPSGIIAAKYLGAEKVFDEIVVFEQRGQSGGIWKYTGDQRTEDLMKVPQTDPSGRNQDPEWKPASKETQSNGVTNGNATSPSFLSPLYERLETNIPRGLMGFQDLNWPEDSQLFPKHQTVLRYIQGYGKDVQDLIQHETQVVKVEATDNKPDGQWTVTTRNLRDNSHQEKVFDAVIVANGHFIVPFIPDIPGVHAWNEKYPNAISHSKYFRRPEDFSDKKVIVTGNSASGSDISTQICQYSQQPLLWSCRSSSMFKPAPSALKREVPPIARFIPENRSVEFEDGTLETDIDAVVFATGYLYSMPFLDPYLEGKGLPKLITDGSHVHNTHQHIFYAPRPTLSFLALNQRVIPFPLAEAQASVIARVYANRLSLPALPEMRAWEQKIETEMGNGRNFHLLPFPKDAHYINEMSTWALGAETREGLEGEGVGKRPPVWGKWEFWCREKFPEIRRAFTALGEERKEVRTLEEVGFWFEESG